MASVVVSEGIVKEVIKPGGGDVIRKGDEITVHCTGSHGDTGAKFWSTKDPDQEPFSFKVGVGEVIPGWDEGCLTMTKGEIAKLTLDPGKAYGPGGFPAWNIRPNEKLIFEIEILSISSAKK